MTELEASIQGLIESRARDCARGLDFPMPGLRAPASREAIQALENRAGFHFPADYTDFLKVSDGMDDFYFETSLIGTFEWPNSLAVEGSWVVRSAYEQSGMLLELGIARDPEDLFPIGGGEGTDALFVANPLRLVAPGPIVWLQHSDVRYFRSMVDLFIFEADEVGYDAAGRALRGRGGA